MFSLSRQSIRSDASRFGRWNHQSSLSVIDRARLQMVDMSLFGETHSGWRLWCHPHAHPQTRTHTHTHTHTHTQSWALSLTSISCSVRVSLFLSLQIRLFSLSLFFIFLFSSDHRHFFSTVTLLPHYNSNNFCVSLPLSQLLTNTVKKKKNFKKPLSALQMHTYVQKDCFSDQSCRMQSLSFTAAGQTAACSVKTVGIVCVFWLTWQHLCVHTTRRE